MEHRVQPDNPACHALCSRFALDAQSTPITPFRLSACRTNRKLKNIGIFNIILVFQHPAKGFFDALDWKLRMKAKESHTPPERFRLCIEQWLKALAEDDRGMIFQEGGSLS